MARSWSISLLSLFGWQESWRGIFGRVSLFYGVQSQIGASGQTAVVSFTCRYITRPAIANERQLQRNPTVSSGAEAVIAIASHLQSQTFATDPPARVNGRLNCAVGALCAVGAAINNRL